MAGGFVEVVGKIGPANRDINNADGHLEAGTYFPVVDDNYIEGGFRIVDTIAQRDAIPASLKKTGMVVRVSGGGDFEWDGAAWQPYAVVGGSVGPGTDRTIAMFDATTTDVQDSNLSQDVSGNVSFATDAQLLPDADGSCDLGQPGNRFRSVNALAVRSGDLLLHNPINGTKLRLVEGRQGELYLVNEISKQVFLIPVIPTSLTVEDLDIAFPIEE